MTGSIPTPRPALRKAPGSDVHPVAPRHRPATSIGGATSDVLRGERRGAGGSREAAGGAKSGLDDLEVARAARRADPRPVVGKDLETIKVTLPADVRKRLRKKAKKLDLSTDEVVVALLRAWLAR